MPRPAMYFQNKTISTAGLEVCFTWNCECNGVSTCCIMFFFFLNRNKIKKQCNEFQIHIKRPQDALLTAKSMVVFLSAPLPMCWAQVSQYSAYKDSKQLQQYGRPSFMMYRWPPSTVSHSKQQKCFMCQCLPSASVHSSAKIIWGKRTKESGLGLRGW